MTEPSVNILAIGAEAARERRMFLRLHDPDDPLDVGVVVARYLPLAWHVARFFRATGEAPEDLTQVATVGLLKAIRRFDVHRGPRFSTYALPVIRGEVLRHLRDGTWPVHVGRDQQVLALRVDRRAAELGVELGRSPTVGELAEACGCGAEDVIDARVALHAYRPASLDRPVHDADAGDVTGVDLLGGDDPELEEVLDRCQFEALLGVLPRRDRRIVALRYRADLSQNEIARRVGLSQMHVSRVLRSAHDLIAPAVADGARVGS